MKKIVITGFSGFVASHFIDYLYENDIKMDVYGFSREDASYDYRRFADKLRIKYYPVNLMDADRLKSLIMDIKPDYILHLAAFSSVAYSWKHPEESFTNNCNIFLNLVDAVRQSCPQCRILSVGSSEEYGNISHTDLPLCEKQHLNPVSPYAVAKVSQEMLSKVYVDAFGMQIIMTRSFNHFGPRQDDRFVIPSFIKKILEIKLAGKTEGEIETGDLTIIRDFVDVRDVVNAYYLLLIKGTPGEVYNICSGSGMSLSKVVDIIANEVGIKVKTVINSDYVRPNDNKEIIGAKDKIETELGWRVTRKFRDTIRDMIEYQKLYEKNKGITSKTEAK